MSTELGQLHLYLPRLREPAVLLRAVDAGVGLLTWENESFAYADSYDEDAKRYRGLLGGQVVSLTDVDVAGVLVKPDVARRQLDAEQTTAAVTPVPTGDGTGGSVPAPEPGTEPRPPAEVRPKRFHGSVSLDATLGGTAETARELCYRLYTLCERKKRAAEALSYNGLVQSWPEDLSPGAVRTG